MITPFLLSANVPQFPDHVLLGEENVEPGAEASTAALKKALEEEGSEWLWIVDPIDGTTNFVHGMPLSAVSIGVAYKGELVVGEPTCRSCLSMPFHSVLLLLLLLYVDYFPMWCN